MLAAPAISSVLMGSKVQSSASLIRVDKSAIRPMMIAVLHQQIQIRFIGGQVTGVIDRRKGKYCSVLDL